MALSVGIFVGSGSDVPKLEKGIEILRQLGIAHRLSVCSAHRDLERLRETVAAWEKEGAKVFIAAAGLAAHLPGVIASLSLRPVIGVPLSAAMNGLDSLLSVVQMPGGIPVASGGVDNAVNAAVLAAEILALEDSRLYEKLSDYRDALRRKSLEDNEKLGS